MHGAFLSHFGLNHDLWTLPWTNLHVAISVSETENHPGSGFCLLRHLAVHCAGATLRFQLPRPKGGYPTGGKKGDWRGAQWCHHLGGSSVGGWRKINSSRGPLRPWKPSEQPEQKWRQAKCWLSNSTCGFAAFQARSIYGLWDVDWDQNRFWFIALYWFLLFIIQYDTI